MMASEMGDALPLFSAVPSAALNPGYGDMVNAGFCDDSIRLLIESFTEPSAEQQFFVPEAQGFDSYISDSPSSPSEGVESGFSSPQTSPLSSPQQYDSSYSSPTPSPQFFHNAHDFSQFTQSPSFTQGISDTQQPQILSYPSPTNTLGYPQTPSLPVPPQIPTQVVQATTSATKKRRRTTEDNVDTSEVLLSREELLNLSSKAMEKYIHSLKQTRELSREEEKELKKQRRLIKNREYAQQSRKKKKSYVGELEAKVEVLTAQNAKLQAEVAMLNAKVMAVTSENAMLRNSLSQMQTSTPSPAKKKSRTLAAWPFGSSDTTKIVGGTGALLCGILFFALFFSFDFSGLGYGPLPESLDYSRSTARVLLEERDELRKASPVASSSTSQKATREISGLNCNLNDICFLQSKSMSEPSPAHAEQPSLNPDTFSANNGTTTATVPVQDSPGEPASRTAAVSGDL